MAMIGKVKRMHFCEKKSVREIVRLKSLSHDTARKWLKAVVRKAPSYRRGEMPGKFTPFNEEIKQALKVDEHRPRHELRMSRLSKRVTTGGVCSRVTDFIRLGARPKASPCPPRPLCPWSSSWARPSISTDAEGGAGSG
jgi:hypothetical protein